MWIVDKILDLLLEAVKEQLIKPGIDRRKIEKRVKEATAEALQPLMAYLDQEKIPREKQERLVGECIQSLRTLTENPQKLFEASLDGENIFEQLFPKAGRPQNLPQVIREDGLEGIFSMLVPAVADLLCKVPAAIKDWEPTRDKEFLKRFDELPEEIRRVLEKLLEEYRQKPVETVHPGLLLTSLPRRAEHFTGREKEMKRLLELLEPGCRVSLCAAGGMGKTALALEALHVLVGDDESLRIAYSEHYDRLKERFPDGAFFYTFYHQKEADLCLEAVCRVFGEQPLPNPQEAARRALAEKRALLVLDGAEETDNLPGVLAVCGACGVLVTTRKKRDAQGGQVIEVKPLPEDKSLRLLRKWAGKYALDGGGGVQSSQEIIALTGGLPLATSIIGKYLKQRPEYAADYLKWLRGVNLKALSPQDSQHQHENIEVLLERSLNQVPETSRLLMAVSAALEYAPFPIDLLWAGAAELTTEDDKRAALDPLLNYGLLQGGRGNYQVAHLLLYAYARKKLALANERLLGLARYGVALAEREVPRGPQGFRTLDAYRSHLIWLETKLLKMEGREEEQEAALGLVRDLAWSLYDYLQLDGRWTEWISAMQTALEAARLAGERKNEGAWLGNLGNAYGSLGQYGKAIEFYQQALRIARETGDRQGEGSRLGNLGIDYKNLGQYEKAIEYHQQALAIAREIGDGQGEGSRLGNLGNAYRSLGQYPKAIEYYQQALAVAREIGDRRGEGEDLGNLGNAYLSLGQYPKAIEHYQQALRIAREIGDRQGEGNRLANLGLLHMAQGDLPLARQHWQQALVIYEQIGSPYAERVRGWLEE